MKTEFVSIKSAVYDWLDDNDFGHDEIRESTLIRWAGDCVRWCSTQDQLRPRIGIFQVVNSRFRLPEDYVLLGQAASNVDYTEPCDCDEDKSPGCCEKSKIKQGRMSRTRREDLVQWVQGTLEKDCELEINLICPTCSKTGCSCDTPLIEVDVDRIWEMAHPEIYYSNFTRIGRFGNGPGQNSPYASAFTPKFRLMRYAIRDYHRLREVMGDCPNVNCDNCHKEFVIQRPYLEVDFDKGEVLLAYLGKTLDENGDIMIPDHPDIHEAIGHHLDFKWYSMKWKKEKDQANRAIAADARALREEHIGIAQSSLEIPSFMEFKNYLETSAFLKRIPGYLSDRAGNRVSDKHQKHGRRLDGGDYRY